MDQRNRAWRRRKARNVIERMQETRRWVAQKMRPEERTARPHGAQKARAWWSTEQEARESLFA